MYDARKYVHSTRDFPRVRVTWRVIYEQGDVRRALHAEERGTQRFKEVPTRPLMLFPTRMAKGATEELAYVLEAGIRVLVYSGQYDLICNHLGTETALRELQWSGKDTWGKAHPGVWQVKHQPAGYSRQYRNLQFLVVLNSGHMVPMDQLEIALEMFKTFLGNREFFPSTIRLK